MVHHLGLKGRTEVLLRASWVLCVVWYISSYIYPPIKAREWHSDIQGLMNKA